MDTALLARICGSLPNFPHNLKINKRQITILKMFVDIQCAAKLWHKFNKTIAKFFLQSLIQSNISSYSINVNNEYLRELQKPGTTTKKILNSLKDTSL